MSSSAKGRLTSYSYFAHTFFKSQPGADNDDRHTVHTEANTHTKTTTANTHTPNANPTIYTHPLHSRAAAGTQILCPGRAISNGIKPSFCESRVAFLSNARERCCAFLLALRPCAASARADLTEITRRTRAVIF